MNFPALFSWENFTISFFGSLGLFILILLHNKAHIFHISIAKKINELEEKNKLEIFPLTSIDKDDFKIRINDLERNYLKNKKHIGAKFGCVRKNLAFLTISSWVRNIMIISFLITFSFSFICLFVLLRIWLILNIPPPPYRRGTPFALSVLKVLQNGSLSHSSPIPNRIMSMMVLNGEKRSFARPESRLWDEAGSRAKSVDFELWQSR